MKKNGSSIPFLFGDEVKEAIDNSSPLVAFETAFMTHGLPEGVGIEVMNEMMEACRSRNVVPAPIGVLDGNILVGMNEGQLSSLSLDPDREKIGSRDLGFAASRKLSGGTTVSSTLRISSLAGIDVMATGGIGGIHPVANGKFDISQDLLELSRCPLMIVCSGPKSILDVEATYEMLEALCVPVAAYRTGTLPGFLFDTGIPAERTLDSPEQACRSFIDHLKFTTGCAFLVANPIPRERSMDREYIINLLRKSNPPIPGRSRTPEALSSLSRLSGGRTLKANRSLLVNNARVAAEMASELNALIRTKSK